MNKSISILALGAAFVFSASALADAPHSSASGKKAVASEVDAQINRLDSRIDGLEGRVSETDANLDRLGSRVDALEGGDAAAETLTVAGNLFPLDRATVVQTFEAQVTLERGGVAGFCSRMVRTWNRQDATTFRREDRYFNADGSAAMPGVYDNGTCAGPQNQVWKYIPASGAFGIASIDFLTPDASIVMGTITYAPVMTMFWDNSRLGGRRVAGVSEHSTFTSMTTAYLHQAALIPTSYTAQGGTGTTYHDCMILAFGKFNEPMWENVISCRLNPTASYYSTLATLTGGRYWDQAAD